MSPETQADVLTRTTFQLNQSSSPLALRELIGVLHRVPGVLHAEIAPGANRAIVAHDAGVSGASLVDAAARIGVRLKPVRDTRRATTGAPQLTVDAPKRNLVAFAVLIVLVSFLGAIGSRLAWNQLVLPIVLVAFGRSPLAMRCSSANRMSKAGGHCIQSAVARDELKQNRDSTDAVRRRYLGVPPAIDSRRHRASGTRRREGS